MTYKAFLKELRKLRGQFEFAERSYGVRLRTILPNITIMKCLCPIEAVAVALGDTHPDFARSLKLSVNVRDAIVGGADGRVSKTQAYKNVRGDLLRVLGLKTPQAWK